MAKKYLYALEGLKDVSDTWTGTIHAQNIPPSVVDLAKRMTEWEIENPPTNIVQTKLFTIVRKCGKYRVCEK
jgi:hypothetical protein